MLAGKSALRSGAVSETWPWLRSCASDMSKKYEEVRVKIPLPGGGFAHALRMAIVEFSCLGERRFDIAGYPYESEEDAFASDLERLAQDAETAADAFTKEISSAGQTARRMIVGRLPLISLMKRVLQLRSAPVIFG